MKTMNCESLKNSSSSTQCYLWLKPRVNSSNFDNSTVEQIDYPRLVKVEFNASD